jgi:hypothetical protein
LAGKWAYCRAERALLITVVVYRKRIRRRYIIIIRQRRGSTMREHFKKFLWTSKFWALLGLVGCVSGLYFQRVAANGSGLWCLGLMFLGAAYLEQQD